MDKGQDLCVWSSKSLIPAKGNKIAKSSNSLRSDIQLSLFYNLTKKVSGEVGRYFARSREKLVNIKNRLPKSGAIKGKRRSKEVSGFLTVRQGET